MTNNITEKKVDIGNIVDKYIQNQDILHKYECKLGLIECYSMINQVLNLRSINNKVSEIREYIGEDLYNSPIITLKYKNNKYNIYLIDFNFVIFSHLIN